MLALHPLLQDHLNYTFSTVLGDLVPGHIDGALYRVPASHPEAHPSELVVGLGQTSELPRNL